MSDFGLLWIQLNIDKIWNDYDLHEKHHGNCGKFFKILNFVYMKNILITWWSWFIWSYLTRKLIKDNHVFCVTRRTSDLYRLQDILDNKNLETVYSDDVNDIEKLFKGTHIDYIIHLATTYKKAHEIWDIDAMINTNISLWTYLCQFAIKYWVKYFINTWTFFEYEHRQNVDNIINENTNELPYNLYASTKLSFHNILKYYTSNFDFKAITLRLFSPYWPNDNIKLIPLLIKNIINNWDEELKLSWWEQRLSFTYVDDICNAYIKSIEKIADLKNNYEVFNIWSDKTYSLKEIYKMLCDISWKIWNVKFGAFPYAKNEIVYSQCDYKRAQILLWWWPKTSIKDWLLLTYNSYLNDFWKNQSEMSLWS